jgi:hypothetical protein
VGSYPKADVFTHFDFDGDTDADNNWDNLERFPTPPAVYYDVIESKSHYFITYALFYPRDYQQICLPFACHENDFEGMRLTVKKSMIWPMGSVVLLETLAHGGSAADPHPQMGRKLGRFFDPHVKVVLEKEGHGVHSLNERQPDSEYIEYRFDAKKRGVASYELLSMSYFWEHRKEQGPHRMFTETKFDSIGARYRVDGLPKAFGGTKWTREGANPNWSWEAQGAGVARGEWFFDPAVSVCHVWTCDAGFSKDYVFNPYLGNSR